MDLAGTPWCDGQSCFGLTMKLISSAAHLFGRNRTHIEFLDLADEEIKSRPAMLRAMIDHAAARGINYFAPHSYDYAGGGYNFGDPLFEYQRPVNDYMGRLSYLFSNGTSQPDLAVGYAPETSWAGGNWNNNVLSLTSAVLASNHFELDHVPVELFTDPALTINDGSFTFGTQTYRSLVVPDWAVASLDVVERVSEFVERGGTLAVVGRLPAVRGAR